MSKDLDCLAITRLEEYRYKVSLIAYGKKDTLSIMTGLFASLGIKIAEASQQTLTSKTTDTFEVRVPGEIHWHLIDQDLSKYFHKTKDEACEFRKVVHQRMVYRILQNKSYYAFPDQSPISFRVDQEFSENETMLEIRSCETPAFFYILTQLFLTLNLNVLRIQREETIRGVFDRIWIQNEFSNKVIDAQHLRAIEWTVLLINAFMPKLKEAKRPAEALDALYNFITTAFASEDYADIFLLLKHSPKFEIMLEAFDFNAKKWKSFLYGQIESLTHLLENNKGLKSQKGRKEVEDELRKKFSFASNHQAKIEILNQYKVSETCRIELRHLLDLIPNLESLAEEYDSLAMGILQCANELTWTKMLEERDHPMVHRERQSELSIWALGALGGRELGFGAELELMFIYSDANDEDAELQAKNLEFYTDFVEEMKRVTRSSLNYVFKIVPISTAFSDRNLIAISVQKFEEHFQEKIEGKLEERLTLMKLRPVLGNPKMTRHIQAVRDHFVFSEAFLDFDQALSLRDKAISDKVPSGQTNPKCSRGGLDDIDRVVQMVQMARGHSLSGELLSTNTREALRAFAAKGILETNQINGLGLAYEFFSKLIYAMRMSGAHTDDLSMPEKDSEEYATLARRIGFTGGKNEVSLALDSACFKHFNCVSTTYEDVIQTLKASQTLSPPVRDEAIQEFEVNQSSVEPVECLPETFETETHQDEEKSLTAENFEETVFAAEPDSQAEAPFSDEELGDFPTPEEVVSLPPDVSESLAEIPCVPVEVAEVTPEPVSVDLPIPFAEILRGELTLETQDRLKEIGFFDLKTAKSAFQRLYPGDESAESFCAALNLEHSVWNRLSDPDLALNNLEQFCESYGHADLLWSGFVRNEKAFDRLLILFSSSKYLSQTLIQNPTYWDWVQLSREYSIKSIKTYLSELRTKNFTTKEELLISRHRETLRIALAEMFENVSLKDVFECLSDLADIVLTQALKLCSLSEKVALLAIGKLGGRELNFSSDIDLLVISESGANTSEIQPLVESFVNFLQEETLGRFLYRVDLSACPKYCTQGALFATYDDANHYFQNQASVTERQGLIKARVVAGKIDMGEVFLRDVVPSVVYHGNWRGSLFEQLKKAKKVQEQKTEEAEEDETNLKEGVGGIRDIEFTLQCLQLLNGTRKESLKTQNTFDVIREVFKHRLISIEDCGTLKAGYIFFRRIENTLHLYENKHVTVIPKLPSELEVLALKLGFEAEGNQSAASRFKKEYLKLKRECRFIFDKVCG